MKWNELKKKKKHTLNGWEQHLYEHVSSALTTWLDLTDRWHWTKALWISIQMVQKVKDVYKMAQLPFSLKGFSLGLLKPRIKKSSSRWESQYFWRSSMHWETRKRVIWASHRSCSIRRRCCCRPSWNLFMVAEEKKKKEENFKLTKRQGNKNYERMTVNYKPLIQYSIS